jgi:hypothetical protein
MAKHSKATLNLKDMQFIQAMQKHSGYDYAKCCEIIGQQVLIGLNLTGDDAIQQYLLGGGNSAKVTIDHHGTGLFDLENN